MIETGLERVDAFLNGGIPERSAVLLYGPPFVGKEVLCRHIAAESLRQGRPVIWVATKQGHDELRDDLTNAGIADMHLLHVVDTYSRSIDSESEHEGVEFLDSSMDLNGVSLAIGKLQAGLVKDHKDHLLIIDSISTFVAYGTPQTSFRFLQILLGRVKRAGATSICLMDEGMHSDAEMRMFKHIMDGSIETHFRNNVPMIHAEGIGIHGNMGWVEYEFSDEKFDITGLFSMERIL